MWKTPASDGMSIAAYHVRQALATVKLLRALARADGMNECYCWTHRYKRQGSHAHPSLTNLVSVNIATRSDISAKETKPATCD